MGSTQRTSLGDTLFLLDRVVEDAVAKWNAGALPDARGVIDAHPELLEHRNVLFDLILAEGHQRRLQGMPLGPLTYREQFESFGDSIASSVERLMAVDQIVGDRIDWQSRPWPQIGETIAEFRLMSELGRGAFARVYECEDTTIAGRRVAVKVTYRPGDEVQRLGPLSHPNIVPIYATTSAEACGATLIVMPLLARLTLEQLIHSLAYVTLNDRRSFAHRAAMDSMPDAIGDVDRNEAVSSGSYLQLVAGIGSALCGALQHAHSRNALHLDVKPSNILFSPRLEPLLIDFNLSCPTTDDRRITGGTREYMPPEFWQPQTAVPQPASDTFSLCVTLAEAVVCRRPLSKLSELSLKHLEADGALAEQRRLIDEVAQQPWGRQLAEALRGGIAANPADRTPISVLKNQLKRLASLERGLSRRNFVAAVSLAPVAAATGMAWFASPNTPSAEAVLGLCQAGNFSAALEAAATIQARQPNNTDAQYLQALLLTRSGEINRAQAMLSQLCERTGDEKLYADLAFIHAMHGSFGRALACYRRAIGAGVIKSAHIANNLGCSFWYGRDSLLHERDTKHWRLADDSLVEACESNSALAEPWANRLRMRLDQLNEIREHGPQSVLGSAAEDHDLYMELKARAQAPEFKLTLALWLANSVAESPTGLQRAEHYLSEVLASSATIDRHEWQTHWAYAPFRSNHSLPTLRSNGGAVISGVGPCWLPPEFRLISASA